MRDMFDFEGKNVFIMGGTSGINLGIAECFAQGGAYIDNPLCSLIGGPDLKPCIPAHHIAMCRAMRERGVRGCDNGVYDVRRALTSD